VRAGIGILPHGIICAFHSLSLRERAGERGKSKSSDCAVWRYSLVGLVATGLLLLLTLPVVLQAGTYESGGHTHGAGGIPGDIYGSAGHIHGPGGHSHGPDRRMPGPDWAYHPYRVLRGEWIDDRRRRCLLTAVSGDLRLPATGVGLETGARPTTRRLGPNAKILLAIAFGLLLVAVFSLPLKSRC